MVETEAHTEPVQNPSSWERFELLYRSSREDVTALAFERAYRRRLTFDRRRGEERAWLFGIARNAALDELRRRKRLASLVVEPEDMSSVGIEDGAEVALRRTAVRSAMS